MASQCSTVSHLAGKFSRTFLDQRAPWLRQVCAYEICRIFRALLNSMLAYFPSFLGRLTAIFDEREKRFGGYMAGRWKWTSKELQEFFTAILTKETQRQPVTIFIDALDECGEGLAKNLLAYFRDLTRQAVDEGAQQIENEILSKAQGGFQWVFLVTETVLYAALLAGGTTAERRQMVKLFQWVLFAMRPLSAQELREALATDIEICSSIAELRNQDCWSDTLLDFERHIKHLSRGLIHFRTRDIWEQYDPDGEDSDREAQLIHQSHILQSQTGAGHFLISRSCFRYLALREVLEAAQLPRGILSTQFPLAPYATRYAFEHILEVEQGGIIQSDLLSVLDPGNAHTPLGWPFIGATEFHVLAALGSKSAFEVLLHNTDLDVDGRDSDMNTPLLIAIREGHHNIALMLLDCSTKWHLHHEERRIHSDSGNQITQHRGSRFVDVNAENDDGDTALTIALTEKADNVIFELIEAGANLKYMGRESMFVFYAVSSRNMKLLDLAIKKNLNLDGAVFFALKDHTPEGDSVLEEIVSELLKAGANTSRSHEFERMSKPEDFDEDYEDEDIIDDDALMLASRRGVLSMVELLLSHGVSATSRNVLGEFPLLVAVDNGHENVIQALLRSVPSAVEMADSDGRTVLDVAFEDQRLDLMRLILKKGSFSTPSPVLENMFHMASSKKEAQIIEMILQKDSFAPTLKIDDSNTMLFLAS
ncbi:ankyrin repeat-containing domain protein, partial [Pyrenochaeta sp. MPI-SDFR-AT-0127]